MADGLDNAPQDFPDVAAFYEALKGVCQQYGFSAFAGIVLYHNDKRTDNLNRTIRTVHPGRVCWADPEVAGTFAYQELRHGQELMLDAYIKLLNRQLPPTSGN